MREMENMTGSLVNKYTDTHTEIGQKEKKNRGDGQGRQTDSK